MFGRERDIGDGAKHGHSLLSYDDDDDDTNAALLADQSAWDRKREAGEN